MRVSTNSCTSFGVMLPVAMVFLLFLCVSQVFVQMFETLGPKPLVVRQPISDILERRGGNPAWPPLRRSRMSLIGCRTTSGFGPRVSNIWTNTCETHRKRRKTMATGSITPKEVHELVLTRIFDAPRKLVFKAWTDPEIVAQWRGAASLY